MRELATDLVKKAKEIDSLIEVLPGIQQTEEEQVIMIIGMFRCIVIIYAIMSN
jgi:ATP/ADP translocase